MTQQVLVSEIDRIKMSTRGLAELFSKKGAAPPFPQLLKFDHLDHEREKTVWITSSRTFGIWHRLLLLKLDKQSNHLLTYSCNKRGTAPGGGGCSRMPCWMQTSTAWWLRGCVSSFSNRRLWNGEEKPRPLVYIICLHHTISASYWPFLK